jgi:hypothetical protein
MTPRDEEGDTPQYLAEWAADVTTAISPDELRDLLRQYNRLARAESASADDRRHARNRGKALKMALEHYP